MFYFGKLYHRKFRNIVGYELLLQGTKHTCTRGSVQLGNSLQNNMERMLQIRR